MLVKEQQQCECDVVQEALEEVGLYACVLQQLDEVVIEA